MRAIPSPTRTTTPLAEKLLAQDLANLAPSAGREAAAKIIALEERHRARRDTLWARLGEAPLAAALDPSRALLRRPIPISPATTSTTLASAYAEEGWRVDAALIDTIAAAGTREDIVARAAGALYRPWADALARRFRSACEAAGDAARPNPLAIERGTLVLFVDGFAWMSGTPLPSA